MNAKKRVLLKITGEIFNQGTQSSFIQDLIAQLKQLSRSHHFSIVIGGGNLFRGNQQGKQLGLTPAYAHQIGMLATIMNGLMIKDLFEQHGIATSLLCSIFCTGIGSPISQEAIDDAIAQEKIILFTGGTGNPFFTTDTTAIIRALQVQAAEIWKGTNVAGVYEADPRKNPDARLLPTITFDTALQKKLDVMDLTSYVLAQQHQQIIRVFNIFAEQALIKAATEITFGSVIKNNA